MVKQSKTQCSGCGACVNICPVQCIEMRADEEGFLYPITDSTKCIECELCDSVCPNKYPFKEEETEQKAYFVQNKSSDVLANSTSGGFFTAIAEYVVSKGGIVFGAVMDANLYVKHIGIHDKDGLCHFRKSKYVQSDIGNTYKEAKNELNKEKLVCFSGTPCQIEGLKRFLGREYDNLITCDVVCHSVPSPLVFSKYIEYIEAIKEEHIVKVLFRDKSAYGYKYNVITALNDKGEKIYQCGVESDPYFRAFFTDVSVRPSCYHCSFKKQYRVSDFTMWDAFNVGRFSKDLDNDRGATRVLIHSEKGKVIFEKVKNNFNFCQTTPEKITDKVKEMYESISDNPQRTHFFNDINSYSGKELFNKYYPDTMRIRIERYGRKICYKIGIYNYIKKLVVILLRKY